MTPQNSVPSRIPRPVPYTDGSLSREYEDSEEEKKFLKGLSYKNPSILNVRDELKDLNELLDVISSSLMCDPKYFHPLEIYNVIQLQIIPKIKALEEELANL